MTNSLKVGTKMKDGTYYVGISPDTKLPMYAAPSDAPMSLDFNHAVKYAKDLAVGGRKGFRVPTFNELNVVRDALLGSKRIKNVFKLSDLYPYYWSSSPSIDGTKSLARCLRLSDGYQSNGHMKNQLSVRPVRSLPGIR